MKKLTQLIKESLINYDFIEDVMVHLEDMGFKIVIFNDMVKNLPENTANHTN